MPGRLADDALCPRCGLDLAALCDETTRDGVHRTFYHGPETTPCIKTFTDHGAAKLERDILEGRVIPQ